MELARPDMLVLHPLPRVNEESYRGYLILITHLLKQILPYMESVFDLKLLLLNKLEFEVQQGKLK